MNVQTGIFIIILGRSFRTKHHRHVGIACELPGVCGNSLDNSSKRVVEFFRVKMEHFVFHEITRWFGIQ